jgi:restriction system protein
MTYISPRQKAGYPLKKPIPPHGGYRQLKSYQMATLVYDLTVEFCRRFVDCVDDTNRSYRSYKTYSRQADQMIQAARSGKQNIAEGTMVSGTSNKTEMKLVGVARASLEELLQDYEDFLRQRELMVWSKDDPRARRIRALAYRPDKSYMTYTSFLRKPEPAANTMICLIHQANYLLDQQLRALEKEFLDKGGFTERLYDFRRRSRTADSRQS